MRVMLLKGIVGGMEGMVGEAEGTMAGLESRKDSWAARTQLTASVATMVLTLF